MVLAMEDASVLLLAASIYGDMLKFGHKPAAAADQALDAAELLIARQKARQQAKTALTPSLPQGGLPQPTHPVPPRGAVGSPTIIMPQPHVAGVSAPAPPDPSKVPTAPVPFVPPNPNPPASGAPISPPSGPVPSTPPGVPAQHHPGG